MGNRTIQKIYAAGIISCLFFAAPVIAENATSLETLTVTAQKKEENLQDVPISMELFTDMDMEDYGLDSMSDVILQSANVFMKSNTAENPLIIRGISSLLSLELYEQS
ncbi:MAG: hypothetical protein CSA26_13390 [Desulfobacterales bacterium]|nr:MAG: hypothetical protein CSA26_13390 [Desulfobacterales bacterium]